MSKARRQAEAWIPAVLAQHGVEAVAAMSHQQVRRLTPDNAANQGRALYVTARVVASMMRSGEWQSQSGVSPDRDPEVETREDADGLSLTYDGRVTSLDELLERARVDASEWGVRRWDVGTYEVTMRGPSDRPITVPMWRVRAALERRPDADLPDLSTLPPAPWASSAPVDGAACLHIPDSQHGFVRRDGSGELVPLHDRRAWAVAVEVARQLRPGIIHLCGDMLDLAAWSLTYPTGRQHIDTTGHTLHALHDDIRALRQASPGSRIIYTSGNHEHRIDRALVSQMGELAGLTAVGDDEPLVSVPRLLALHLLDVEWHPYEADVWVGDEGRQPVRLTHGTKHGRAGQTVARYLSDVAMGGHSTVVGHTHSAEIAYQRLVGPDGERVVYAMSPGTIADIGGDIPAAIAPDRRTWTQGLGVTRWDEATGLAHGAVYPIHGGSCIVEGRRVSA